jgi:hypothetical protein
VSTISVDYDVLNQRGSPAWFSDTFANIPTAGFKGRMFISIDTFAFYRDTGTGWDLIGGPGSGTLTGSGVAGQVSYFNGTQTITGNNNLFWDSTNNRLGIGTITPGQSLDIHSTGNTLVQLNNTSTGNSNISFQNQDVAKWRVGNLYNAGANSFDIQNATLSTTALSINNTNNYITINGIVDTGTNEIAASVYTARGDGTNAGSIYLKQRTSISGASSTYSSISASGTTLIRFGLNDGTTNRVFNFSAAGLSTTSRIYTLPNADGTFALTSDLGSYLPLAGGTLTGNLTINPTNTGVIGLDVASNTTIIRSDNLEGFKRQLEIVMSSGTLIQLTAKGYGASYITDMSFVTSSASGSNATPGIYITGTNNRVGIKTGTPAYDLDVSGTFRTTGQYKNNFSGQSISIDAAGTGSVRMQLQNNSIGNAGVAVESSTGGDQFTGSSAYSMAIGTYTARDFHIGTNSAVNLTMKSGGNVLIGKTSDNGSKFQVYGITRLTGTTNDSSASTIFCENNLATILFYVRNDGLLVSPPLISTHTTGSAANMYVDPSNGSIYRSTSSIKYKKNVEDYNKGLDIVMQLRPITYQGKNELDKGKIFAGFIAEEIHELGLTEFVQYAKDGSPDALAYQNMVSLLTKALQELNQKLIRNNIN